MEKSKEHPEAVQVTIEILENIPDGLLEEFIFMIKNNPEFEVSWVWKCVVNEWYNK